MSDESLNYFAAWRLDAMRNGWLMPRAAFWKRFPVIRHMRYFLIARRVSRHEEIWRAVGAIPQGYDRWVLYGIWHGYERPLSDD